MARQVLAAGAGSALTDSIFNPLECVKVRMQISSGGGGSVGQQQQYRSLGQTLRRILAEEGLWLLWTPGLPATWLRGLTYTGFRVGMYPSIKAALPLRTDGGDGSGSSGLLGKVVAGATSGVIGAVLFTPTDVVRIRLQGDAGALGADGVLRTGLRAGRRPRYRSTAHAFGAIAREEGVLRGLWRGVSSNIARASLLSGGQLATYDQLKETLRRPTAEGGVLGAADGPALHLGCSFVSALVAQTVCMPADTMKTKVMADGGGQFRGLLDCAAQTLRAEGARGFFRGYAPAMARQGPVMVLQMPIVEQLRRLLGLEYM